jgi:MFS transporter, ACS family, tartrate transporter
MSNSVEPSALERKVARRLLWILMPAMLVAFMDRINISFAAPTMNPALGIDAAIYPAATVVEFCTAVLIRC